MFPPLLIPSAGYPAVGDVRLGTTVANDVGTLVTSGGTYAAATDVRLNVDRGDGTLGTLNLPPRTYVDSSQTFDNGVQGDLVTPPVAKVLTTEAAYGPGAGTSGGLAGTYHAPTTSQVQSGVTFGPASALVGTYGGGTGIPAPTAPNTLTGALLVIGGDGSPRAGVVVSFSLRLLPATDTGHAAVSDAVSYTSDVDGYVFPALVLGAEYYYWGGGARKQRIIIPSTGTTYTLPTLTISAVT